MLIEGTSGMNHIRVETNEDTLTLIDNCIIAKVDNVEYSYNLDEVEKIVLLTTDMGPFYDDMGLAVDVGNDTAIFIMSEHRCYKEFLFDQIGKNLPIDYQKIIDASICTDNNMFVIYKRN